MKRGQTRGRKCAGEEEGRKEGVVKGEEEEGLLSDRLVP